MTLASEWTLVVSVVLNTHECFSRYCYRVQLEGAGGNAYEAIE